MTGAPLVARGQLQVGPLLAEGGEGRVYELPGSPGQVYKAYRTPQPAQHLAELVACACTWSETASARIHASSAWPTAVVCDHVAAEGLGKSRVAQATGILLPRAPRRFSVRHRDGVSHLATLSYLTADPARRSAAYGIDLPAPMSAERLGLCYALARLVEAFESGDPDVSHGDLSAKNVLWSLSRGPEVFVIDCDNGERFDAGTPLGAPDRRRAMTPNWDDPSVAAGANPGAFADRYSLALIFLRVCGAAHYPIQKRQKAGEDLDVSIGVPHALRRVRSLGGQAPLWDLAGAGLGAEPASRPAASAWVAALEAVIGDLDEARILDSVWAAQGRAPLPPPSRATPPPAAATAAHSAGMPSPATPPLAAATSSVTVRPVVLRPQAASRPGTDRLVIAASASGDYRSGWTVVRTRSGGMGTAGMSGPPSGWAVGPGGQAAASARLNGPVGAGARANRPAGPSLVAQVRSLLAGIVSWIVSEHRTTLHYLRSSGQRSRGVWRIPWCVAIDFAAACLVLFFAAMVASPFLGV